MAIPPEAAAKNDFSFLNGCWKADSLTYYKRFTPYHAAAELCFNGSNNGSFISHLGGGCRAGATARFSSGSLLIQTGNGKCRNGEVTMPRLFQCEGMGGNTECYILAKDVSDRKRIFKSRAHFYKK